MELDNIIEDVLVLKDYKTVPDIVHEYGPTIKFGHIPLVIDNGKSKYAFKKKYIPGAIHKLRCTLKWRKATMKYDEE